MTRDFLIGMQCFLADISEGYNLLVTFLSAGEVFSHQLKNHALGCAWRHGVVLGD